METYNLAVSYDLKNAAKEDYRKIAEGIGELGDATRKLESLWFVQSLHTAHSAREFLKHYVKPDDKIVVMRVLDAASEDIEHLTHELSKDMLLGG